MNQAAMIMIVPKVLEVAAGLVSLIAFSIRMKKKPGEITQKDLLVMLEEKDRELERTRIEAHAWKLRYEQATTCNP